MEKRRHLLLGSRGCGNAIVEAAFALAGVPLDYEEVNYSSGSPTRPRLLEVNSLGQVPTLVLPDGRVMSESLAMIHYLDDLSPATGLVPAAGTPGRVEFLRWSTFIVAAIYPTFTYGDEPAKWVGDPQAGKLLRASTDRHREALWQQAEAAAGSPWFLGQRMTAIDLYVAVMFLWRPGRKWFEANTPKLLAIAEKTAATPGVAAAMARNFPDR